MSKAYLGLGSNIGDKVGHIRRAAWLIGNREGIQNVELSPLFRTAPIGKLDQDWFVNAVARVETSLSPRGLLAACLEVERKLKRERIERWGPRTLDIDILIYEGETVSEEGLEIPHPRMADRAFVLAPLSRLDGGIRIDGMSVLDLVEETEDQGAEEMKPKVAILGASEKPERYANMAQKLLMEQGYSVLPISPKGGDVLGVAGAKTLQECQEDVDTVTLYIGSNRVESVVESIIERHPRRVIFNPGTENDGVRQRLEAAGIETIEGCTLVMLRTGQF